MPLTALPASAATVGGFEIDGNQTHEAAEDWKDLTSAGDGVKTPLADTADKRNRTLTTFLDNTTGGQDDTVAGSNNKEDPPGGSQWPGWSWTDTGNATGKSDYGRVRRTRTSSRSTEPTTSSWSSDSTAVRTLEATRPRTTTSS